MIRPPPVKEGDFPFAWVIWFQTVYRALTVPAAGPTANRPVEGLVPGTTYFDQTLGHPVWWTGTVWVNSSGTPT